MRVKGGGNERRKHRKILKLAKGYRLSRNRIFRRANESILHSSQYSIRDRRKRHAQMRRLWILRINAALSSMDLKYKDFINGLKKANIQLDRKVLAEMAVSYFEQFKKVVEATKLK